MLAVGKATAFACSGGNKNCRTELPILYSNTRRFDFLIAFNRLGLLGENRTSRGLHFLPSACPPSDGGEEGSVVRRSKCGFGQTQWQLPNVYSEGANLGLWAVARRRIM